MRVVTFLFVFLGIIQNVHSQCELTISPVNPAGACKYAVENVVWTDQVNVTSSTNSLSKTSGGNNNWNAGAASTATISDYGYVEFTSAENNRDKMVGLSDVNTNANFNTIDYAWHLRSNGQLRIYESGSNRGNFGTYNAGDSFRVAIDASTIKYYQNGNLIYLSNVAPTLPMLVDLSVNDLGGTVNDVKIANGFDGGLTLSVGGTGVGTGPTYDWQLNGSSVAATPTYTNTSLIDGDSVQLILTPGAGGCSGVNDTSNYIVVRQENNFDQFTDIYLSPQYAFPSCINSRVKIAWTDIVNLEETGNNLNKIQGGNNNWNAGAASRRTINNGGKLLFTVAETNRDRMIGLSDVNINTNFNTIDYAWYLRNNGQISIFESGSNRGTFGTYNSGDTFSIEIIQNEIKYFQNGNLAYVSSVAPALPLIADVSVNDIDGTIENAEFEIPFNAGTDLVSTNLGTNPSYQWYLNGVAIGSDTSYVFNDTLEDGDLIYADITPDLGLCTGLTYRTDTAIILLPASANIDTFYTFNQAATSACQEATELVTWTDVINLEADGNNLEKIQGGSGNNNGGAASLNRVFDNGRFEFIARLPGGDTDGYIGLSNTNTDNGSGSIEYAFHIRDNGGGTFQVFESGSNRGTFPMSDGDTLAIQIEDGIVKYYNNGVLQYISAVAPTLPMIADVSLSDIGSRIENAQITNGNTGDFVTLATDIGLNPTYSWFLNGLPVGINDSLYSNTSLSDGDIITCNVIPDIPGCNSSTSVTTQQVIIGNIPSATFGTFYAFNEASTSACQEARELITWTDLVNVEATGNSIEKIQGGDNNNNGGAASLNQVYDNGRFEFVARLPGGDTDGYIGLSNTNTDNTSGTIEYAFQIRDNGGGTFQIFESGANRGTFTLADQDTLGIHIENGVVRYYRNGVLQYISSVTPTLPMIADVSLSDEGARIENASVVNGNTGVFTTLAEDAGANVTYEWFINGVSVGNNDSVYTNTSLTGGDTVFSVVIPDLGGCSSANSYTTQPIIVTDIPSATFGTFYAFNEASTSACQEARELITWTDLVNVEATGNDLEKIQGGNDNNNGGAASLNRVYDNGRFEFIARLPGGDTDGYIGLSNSNADNGSASIEYAFQIRDNGGGSFQVFESGTNRGTYPLADGDTLGIHIDNGTVKYYRNGVLQYISAVAPTLPMIADVSLSDLGSRIEDASVVNGNTGLFTTLAENAGASVTYEWFINSLSVGNNDSIYTNTSLTGGDTVVCNVIPDLGGCSSANSYTTLPVIVTDIPTATFGTFYSFNEAAESACQEATELVTWTDLVNVEATGNSIEKIQGGNNNNNGGAASLNGVFDNGRFEFIARLTGGDTDGYIGLSNTNADNGSASIEYAWHIRDNGGGSVEIFESGVNRGGFGALVDGDTLGIHVEAGVVKYFKNGVIQYISAVAPTLPMIADVSLSDVGSRIDNASVTSGNTGILTTLAEDGGANVTYEWFIDGISVGNNDSIYTNLGLRDGDTIVCNVIPDLGGCSSANSYTTLPIIIRDIQSPTFGTFYAQNEASSTSCQEARENVTWTDIVNVVATGNSLSKLQGGNGSWNAGAASFNEVFDNGRLEFIVTETNLDRLVGLSNANSDAAFASIEYGWNLRNNGQLRIYESNANRGTFGTYSTGDTLEVCVEAGIVKYYQNKSLVYISAVVPSLPMIADVSINDLNGTVTNAVVINGNTGEFTVRADSSGANPTYEWFLNGVTTGVNDTIYTNTSLSDGDIVYCSVIPNLGGCTAANSYQTSDIEVKNIGIQNFGTIVSQNEISPISPLVAYEEVQWTDLTNLELSGNTLSKIQSGGNWDGGAASLNQVSDNSMIQTIVAETNRDRMFGLSSVNTNDNFNTIEYAVQLRSNGQLRVYENGTLRGNFGVYNTLDTIKVVHFNGVIEYYRNQNLLYTSAIAPADTLIGDISIQDVGGTILEATVVHFTDGVFSTSTTGFGANPNFQWLLNGLRVGTNSPNYSNASLINGDIIECLVSPDIAGGCDSTNSFSTNRIFITNEIFPLPLPIELLYFNYEIVEGGVMLNWETLTEINSSYFEVQRSLDASTFENIGRLDSRGSAFSGARYSLIDDDAITGTIYYRLKQTDIDGQVYYSKIISVNLDKNAHFEVNIFPNPNDGQFTIFGLAGIENYQLKITDLQGRKVKLEPTITGESISLDLRDYPKGLYILSIHHSGGKETRRIVIK